jgi:hypothetical protein
VIRAALFAAIVAGYALVLISSVVSLPADLTGIGIILGAAVGGGYPMERARPRQRVANVPFAPRRTNLWH